MSLNAETKMCSNFGIEGHEISQLVKNCGSLTEPQGISTLQQV